MYRILIICCVYFIAGCVGFNADEEMPCNDPLPDKVVKFFESPERPKSKNIYYGEKSELIINGTHDDLFMTELGKIESRKYKWTVKVKFEPHLLYENEKYALILVFSEYRIANFKYLWMILNKEEGKIVKNLRTDVNILERFVYDEIFYFKIGYKDPRIHCMKIGE